jgi:hypothetical protein
MVVDALVYHPTVAHYLRFVSTTGKFSFGVWKLTLHVFGK